MESIEALVNRIEWIQEMIGDTLIISLIGQSLTWLQYDSTKLFSEP